MKKSLLLFACLLISLAAFAQGNALDFDGVDDFVSVPDNLSLDISGDLTIEAWIYLKGIPSSPSEAIIDKTAAADAANYRVYILTDQKIGFWNGASQANSTSIVTTTQWTHTAWVFDNTAATMTFYLNGIIAGTTTGYSLGATNNGILRIGSDIKARFSNIKLDEVRIWNVVRTAGEISGNMNTEIDCATAGLVACYHFNQGSAGGNNAGVTTLTDGTANGNNGTLTNFLLTTGNVSNWVAGATALPVELVSFDARLLGSSILLTWQTATETNNRGWEIEHSTDAKDWKWVGFSGGRGESVELQSYTFTHKRPTPGFNYYRLKQIDFDGKFEYSDVVSVQFALDSPQLEVFPNPASDKLTLYLPESDKGKTIIRLYDQTGKLALQQTTSSQQQTLNVSKLAARIYFVEVTVGGKVFREKVVVE